MKKSDVFNLPPNFTYLSNFRFKYFEFSAFYLKAIVNRYLPTIDIFNYAWFQSLSSAGRDNLINEITALKKLKQRFIVQMLDFSYTGKDFVLIIRNK